MALKTFVKVGKISNLSDARYCAGMGVDILGFSAVSGQDGYMSPTQFKEIRSWFSGPRVVAEVYGVKSSEDLNLISQNYAPDLIELSIREVHLIKSSSLKCLLSLNADEWIKHQDDLISLTSQIEYLLIPSGTDQAILKTVAENFDILVQCNSVSELESHLNNSTVRGISLEGSAEEKPGFKSYDQLSEIFEQLELED